MTLYRIAPNLMPRTGGFYTHNSLYYFAYRNGLDYLNILPGWRVRKQYSTVVNTASPIISLSKRGFSEISFDLSNYSLTGNALIIRIISDLYDALMNLKKGNKYVIITRLIYDDGSVRTLHRSVRVALNNIFVSLFSTFLLDALSLKSNDYSLDSGNIVKITFNFFYITKNITLKDHKWQDLNRTFLKSHEILKFNIGKEHVNLPSNRNYASWGTISTQSDKHLIVTLEQIEKQHVMLEWNKETDEIKISGFPHSFKDSLQSEGIFSRAFSDGTTYYVREGEIVLKTKTIKTKFLKTIPKPGAKENA